MSAVGHAGKSCGVTVRVQHDSDPRRFPAIPRAAQKLERLSQGRTAVERVDERLKVFQGAGDASSRRQSQVARALTRIRV